MNLLNSARQTFTKPRLMLLVVSMGTACSTLSQRSALQSGALLYPGEKHLKNIQQLTQGGTNAEAYWSFDGKWLSFQAKGGGIPGLKGPKPECDQIYKIRPNGTEAQLLSTGKGRTTCAFYLPDNRRILFSSTHETDSSCPPSLTAAKAMFGRSTIATRSTPLILKTPTLYPL